MGELITRGYAAADATAVAELFNALARDAGGPEWAVPAVVQSYVDTYLSDPGRDSRLVLAPDRTLVGVAMVTAPPAGGSHVNLAGGVHPAWRGRGVGRRLLAWQLDRSREIHEAQAPGTGWDVHADADLGGDGEGDAATVRLFRRFGLAPVRYWFSMAAPTAAPPVAAEPDGLRLERYSPGQERALHAAHMEAFADHWGFQLRPLAQWTPTTVGSDRFMPELSLLAFDRDELAGYLLSYRDVDPDRIYIGQVGVRPPWRRRGLAGALLVAVLSAAGKAGRPAAWLRVDAGSPTGAVGVYQRAGFAVESRAVTYAAPLDADVREAARSHSPDRR